MYLLSLFIAIFSKVLQNLKAVLLLLCTLSLLLFFFVFLNNKNNIIYTLTGWCTKAFYEYVSHEIHFSDNKYVQ